jgi:hypothetical protein
VGGGGGGTFGELFKDFIFTRLRRFF